MALDCQYFSRPADELFYNQEFPDVCEWHLGNRQGNPDCACGTHLLICAVHGLPFPTDCWTMPHIVHAFVGAIAVGAFTVLACAFSMGEMEVRQQWR
jgi:hypothetical protein